MAIPKLNSFTSFELSESEQLIGSSLGYEQSCVIRNQLASIAEQKLSLMFDTKDPYAMIAQDAFLSGQIKILQWLLDSSEAAKTNLLNSANNES